MKAKKGKNMKEESSKEGHIIAVSDVHLGYDRSNRDDFNKFIDARVNGADIDHLVLLGDIMDFWRRTNVEAAYENRDILIKLQNLKTSTGAQIKVHYLAGNHDYSILKLRDRYPEYYPLDVRKSIRLKSGESNYYFLHGYELEVLARLEPLSIEGYEELSESLCYMEDVLGRFTGSLWHIFCTITRRDHRLLHTMKTIIKKPEEREENISAVRKLALSEVKNIFLGMRGDEQLVFGHTHKPFLTKDDAGTNVANTGSWVEEGSKQNTYIEIINGEMELKEFSEG